MSTATDGCDGAFWQIVKTQTEEQIISEVVTTFYKYEQDKKVKPDENLGFYKYDVLMIEEKQKEAEFFSAYIGDVDKFINNQAPSMGVGLLVKRGVIPKRTVKKMFNVVLHNLNFSEKSIKSILTQVK
jgi:hypothetical protein